MQRTNERTLAHLRGGKGCHVARFAAQFLDVMKSRKNYSNEQIEAQIIYDELKIKCGIAYNPKTGIPTGITASKNGKSMCFAEEILDLANDSIVLPVTDDNPGTADNTAESPRENIVVDNLSATEDDSELNSEKSYLGVATMVNIFRLRTAFNQTWNVAYYFNCGSLDGDELLRQLIIVIIACELVGIKIKLQMSDAGGANMKAAAYLTQNKCNELPE